MHLLPCTVCIRARVHLQVYGYLRVYFQLFIVPDECIKYIMGDAEEGHLCVACKEEEELEHVRGEGCARVGFLRIR